MRQPRSPPLPRLLPAAFLVVADEQFGRQIPFAFLEKVREEWQQKWAEKGPAAAAHSLDKSFGPRLKYWMEYCEQHPEELSKVASVQKKVRGGRAGGAGDASCGQPCVVACWTAERVGCARGWRMGQGRHIPVHDISCCGCQQAVAAGEATRGADRISRGLLVVHPPKPKPKPPDLPCPPACLQVDEVKNIMVGAGRAADACCRAGQRSCCTGGPAAVEVGGNSTLCCFEQYLRGACTAMP